MNIFKKIKSFLANIGYKNRYLVLQEELNKLCVQQKDTLNTLCVQHQNQTDELRAMIGDPRYVIDKVFGRKVTYYDPNDMSDDSKRKYYIQAQSILNSQAFINTKNTIIARQCQEQARQFNPQQPTNVARDVQMSINALELLEEELASIPNPDNSPEKIPPSKDFNPHAGI